MKILALDTGRKTGWATHAAGGVESGVQEFPPRRGSSAGFLFLEFRVWLTDLVERIQPEVIVYEMAHHRGGAATEIGVNLTGRVQEIAAAHGIEYRGIHTGTLKKYATGSGAAGKGAMVLAASARFSLRIPLVTDDNQADALMMLAWGMDGFPETEPAHKKRMAA